MKITHWHAEDISLILEVLETGEGGLTLPEVEQRLRLNGSNAIEVFKETGMLIRFLRQFHNILIYALLVSAGITSFLGYWVDSSVILGVVILNAIFGMIQEGKAETALNAIRGLLAPTANVIRSGQHLTVPSSTLVVGDIVLLKSGDKVPADLRIIDAKSLRIQESILTGESNVVDKSQYSVAVEAALGDRSCIAYSGTAVTYGKGTGVVIATAADTELGKISSMLKNVGEVTTPLLKKMDVFGKWLTLIISLLAAVTFVVGVYCWKQPIDQMFLSAVGLAVAAIPEGLPPILTIILAIGVTRMARKKAIIRKLPAVETMGSVTTICTDKTGTLTRNEQSIKAIITSTQQYDVNETLLPEDVARLQLVLSAASLCNDGSLFQAEDGTSITKGDPIDQALLDFCIKNKLDLQLLKQSNPRSDLIPYESEHKFMATLHHNHNHNQEAHIYLKGAPEQILGRCRYELVGSSESVEEHLPVRHEYWQERIEALAQQGYRMLALAYKRGCPGQLSLSFADVEQDMVLIAVFALMDAPRTEAADAVYECSQAGIHVKMITGDHVMTASTIAAQVGIAHQGEALTGQEIDAMSDEELREAVKKINVYARTSPQHKLRLVNALQANGEVVAMTGDGVNDAPALRKADIGVAMGQKGAELAKESADMVLADDNFATVVHAIEEGRVVFDNLKKVLLHVLPTNAAEGFVVVVAILFGVALPITTPQILWVNMITAVAMSLSLGFEPTENKVMARPPRSTQMPILSKLLVFRIVFITSLLVAGIFGIFLLLLKIGAELNVARTIAVNLLVFGEAAYLLNCRKLSSSIFEWKNFVDNPKFFVSILATTILQLGFTYLPIMQKFFGTAALNLVEWSLIFSFSLIIFAIIEVEKLISTKLEFS